MEQINHLYYLLVLPFPVFMIACTWLIREDGVVGLIKEYPMWSAVGFVILILSCLQFFIMMTEVEIGT